MNKCISNINFFVSIDKSIILKRILALILTSSAINKKLEIDKKNSKINSKLTKKLENKLEIDKNLEIKLEIYKNLEIKLEIYSYFKLENKLEN